MPTRKVSQGESCPLLPWSLTQIYQRIAHRGAYVGEMLVAATVPVILPYILFRGPANLIASSFLSGETVNGT